MDEKDGDPVTFTPPKGFKPPDVTDPAKPEWDMVCTFKTRPDGRVCMTKIGDTPIPCCDEDDEGKKDEAKDYMAGNGKQEASPSFSGLASQITTGVGQQM